MQTSWRKWSGSGWMTASRAGRRVRTVTRASRDGDGTVQDPKWTGSELSVARTEPSPRRWFDAYDDDRDRIPGPAGARSGHLEHPGRQGVRERGPWRKQSRLT